MEDIRVIKADLQSFELIIPEFRSQPSLKLDLTKIKEGETRLPESQFVNPASYSELEYAFNEGYREGKRHLSILGYQIALTEKALREAKSRALLDEYPVFLKERNFKDSAQIRDAFLETYKDYIEAQDRIDMLKAMESLIDGKIKTFENVCRYMRKEMDLIIRSGVDRNKYLK